MAAARRVALGQINGLYGVRGWVKVFSHTQPRENILGYSPWQLHLAGEWRELAVETGRTHGKGVIAKLAGIDDRDAAAALHGAEIAVWREQLPPPAAGEFYWADLEGLAVQTLQGTALGTVSHLIETGSNDVLVVDGERERLIPFLMGQTVIRVDVENGLLVVDWDPEF